MPFAIRTPFAAATPERASFDTAEIPLSPLVSYFPAPDAVRHDARTRYSGMIHRAVETVKGTVQSNTGMLLVAASQLFFSLMNVWVKKLNSLDPPVPAFELIWVRMAITWICCITYMFIVKVPDPILGPKGVRLLLVARGFFGFFGLFGVYYSLQYLSLSDATVLTFLAPMCTAITGAVLLHEPFSWREALAGLASLFGVVLIARPEFLFGQHHYAAPATDMGHVVEGVQNEVGNISTVTPAQRVGAVGVALLGVLGATGAYTSIRAVGKRAHPLHNLVSFSSQCVIVATLAMIIMRTPVVVPMRWDWLLMLLLIGLFGFVAQIIFATIFERVFFHTSPSFLSVVGTLIILTSAIYVALTKARSTQDKYGLTEGVATGDDPSLEEGLLANHTEELSQESKDLELTSVAVVPLELPHAANGDVDEIKT
ncbi:hypothetical protein BN946_scf184998.g5 [Trametes cinnabarina]|uniref:EamA domain-containing protein n=1 Tax=Pycnoporus cinnabarinus TaxID=5643 RepID=A0A060S7Y7_PYCCI|nr:hypothetical protein BN946_scf184998.g5 [Trametes cinnabarina]